MGHVTIPCFKGEREKVKFRDCVFSKAFRFDTSVWRSSLNLIFLSFSRCLRSLLNHGKQHPQSFLLLWMGISTSMCDWLSFVMLGGRWGLPSSSFIFAMLYDSVGASIWIPRSRLSKLPQICYSKTSFWDPAHRGSLRLRGSKYIRCGLGRVTHLDAICGATIVYMNPSVKRSIFLMHVAAQIGKPRLVYLQRNTVFRRC